MRWSSPEATAGIMARYVLRGLPELSLYGTVRHCHETGSLINIPPPLPG
jgi:hypothetical protein